MITNLGNDVFIDFEPDEFQLNGWGKFQALNQPRIAGLDAQIRTINQAPTFDLTLNGGNIEVTRVQGRIRIDRSQTWVVTRNQTSNLLEHEAGHYFISYITYVLTLQAIRSLRVPVTVAAIPRGSPPQHQHLLMRNALIHRIQPLMTQAGSRMRQLDTQYDAQLSPGTNHGRNRPEQQAWQQRFGQSLASGTAL